MSRVTLTLFLTFCLCSVLEAVVSSPSKTFFDLSKCLENSGKFCVEKCKTIVKPIQLADDVVDQCLTPSLASLDSMMTGFDSCLAEKGVTSCIRMKTKDYTRFYTLGKISRGEDVMRALLRRAKGKNQASLKRLGKSHMCTGRCMKKKYSDCQKKLDCPKKNLEAEIAHKECMISSVALTAKAFDDLVTCAFFYANDLVPK